MKDCVEIYRISNDTKKVIPFYGEGLFCGKPNMADLQPEWYDIRDWFTGGSDEVFVGIVHGDSMKDLGYMPGDLCVVNRELTPKEGSVVVAFIDGEYTMKIFHLDKKKKVVTLFPANDDYEPIEIDASSGDFCVWGVVTKCIKSSRSGLTIIKARSQKRKQEEKEKKDSPLLQSLLPFFWNDKDAAADFIMKVSNAKNTDITTLVAKLVKNKVISDLSCYKPLWEVLNGAGIYKAGLTNWNTMIRQKMT